jgi:hypothetical protein
MTKTVRATLNRSRMMEMGGLRAMAKGRSSVEVALPAAVLPTAVPSAVGAEVALPVAAGPAEVALPVADLSAVGLLLVAPAWSEVVSAAAGRSPAEAELLQRVPLRMRRKANDE